MHDFIERKWHGILCFIGIHDTGILTSYGEDRYTKHKSYKCWYCNYERNIITKK